MFNSPQIQLEMIKKINQEKGWNFTDAHFKKVERLPIQPTEELTTTVLVPYFGTVQKTFDELWQAFEDPEGFTKHNYVDKVRLHSGKHPKKQLKWVVLDMKSEWDKEDGKSVDNVRKTWNKSQEPYDLAGVEVLAAALLHPEYLKAMDGENVPYADLANLKTGRSRCPFLFRWVGARQLELFAHWAVYARREWAASRVREAEFESLGTGSSVDSGLLDIDIKDPITIDASTKSVEINGIEFVQKDSFNSLELKARRQDPKLLLRLRNFWRRCEDT